MITIDNMNDQVRKATLSLIETIPREIINKDFNYPDIDEDNLQFFYDTSYYLGTIVLENASLDELLKFFSNSSVQKFFLSNNLAILIKKVRLENIFELLMHDDIFHFLAEFSYYNTKNIIDFYNEIMKSDEFSESQKSQLKNQYKKNISLIPFNYENFDLLKELGEIKVSKEDIYIYPFSIFVKYIRTYKKELDITDDDLLKYPLNFLTDKKIENFVALFNNPELFFAKFTDYESIKMLYSTEKNKAYIVDYFANNKQKDLIYLIFLNEGIPNDIKPNTRSYIKENLPGIVHTSFTFPSMYKKVLDNTKYFEEILNKPIQDFTSDDFDKYTKTIDEFKLLFKRNYKKLPSKIIAKIINVLRIEDLREMFCDLDFPVEKVIYISDDIIDKNRIGMLFGEKYNFLNDSKNDIKVAKRNISVTILKSLLNMEDNQLFDILSYDINDLNFSVGVFLEVLGEEIVSEEKSNCKDDKELEKRLLSRYVRELSLLLSENKNKRISYNYFRVFFCILGKHLINYYDLPNHDVFVGPRMDSEKGIYMGQINSINVAQEEIRDSIRTNISLFETLFHEVRHAVQHSSMDIDSYSYTFFKCAKDLSLGDEIDGYYNGKEISNYRVTSGEVDARVHAFIETYKFLRSISSSLASNYYENRVEEYQKDSKLVKETSRTNIQDKKVVTLDDYFDATFTPEQIVSLFKEYPILQLEYDETGKKYDIDYLLDVFESIVINILEFRKNNILPVNEDSKKLSFYLCMLRDKFELIDKKLEGLPLDNAEVLLNNQRKERFEKLIDMLRTKHDDFDIEDYGIDGGTGPKM